MSNPFTIRSAVLGVVLCASLTCPAGADVLTLTPNHDNTLIEVPAGNSNGVGDGIYAGRVALLGNGTIRRGLISFDLSGIPASATVDSAVLTLTMVQSTNLLTPTNTLHRVGASWGEESSAGAGQGALADTGDATWTHRFHDTVAWTSPGGDFSATASASQVVGDLGTYDFTGAGLVADVQAWVANPASNFGWLLRGDESVQHTVKKFSSREGFNPPTLRVVYTRSNTGVGTGSPTAVTFAAPTPSPASGPVRLAFALPRPASVSLRVHDASGRLVRSLAEGSPLSSGPHAFTWDARDASGRRVAAGVYFATLQVDGESLVRRMPLLR